MTPCTCPHRSMMSSKMRSRLDPLLERMATYVAAHGTGSKYDLGADLPSFLEKIHEEIREFAPEFAKTILAND